MEVGVVDAGVEGYLDVVGYVSVGHFAAYDVGVGGEFGVGF